LWVQGGGGKKRGSKGYTPVQGFRFYPALSLKNDYYPSGVSLKSLVNHKYIKIVL
jgi:hypothetical protein